MHDLGSFASLVVCLGLNIKIKNKGLCLLDCLSNHVLSSSPRYCAFTTSRLFAIVIDLRIRLARAGETSATHS